MRSVLRAALECVTVLRPCWCLTNYSTTPFVGRPSSPVCAIIRALFISVMSVRQLALKCSQNIPFWNRAAFEYATVPRVGVILWPVFYRTSPITAAPQPLRL